MPTKQYLRATVFSMLERISSRKIAVSLGVSEESIDTLNLPKFLKLVEEVRPVLNDVIVEGINKDNIAEFQSQFVSAMRTIDERYDKSLDDLSYLFRSGKLSKRLKKCFEFLYGGKIEDDRRASEQYYDLCLRSKKEYSATIYTTNHYEDKITMSYGDKWQSCQKVAPCDLPKDHPLYDDSGDFDEEYAGCYASNATSVAADKKIHMLYTSKDGKPYNMTHRALAIEIEQDSFNAIQLERLYPDEQSSGYPIAGSALHNAFLDAATRLAKIRFPDVEEWVVARHSELATTEHFYLDSEEMHSEITFIIFPASVCEGEDPQEWMDNYQRTHHSPTPVGAKPKCTHCNSTIRSKNVRAVCGECGGYDEYDDEDEDDPFAYCEYCDSSIQERDDAVVGYSRERHGTEPHFFCCSYCAERDDFFRVEDEDEDDYWSADDITIDIDGDCWLDAEANLVYSEYHEGYIKQERAVWSEYLEDYIDENYAIFDGFYAEDGDELVDSEIHTDEVVYSEIRKCYILRDFAELHPITNDWMHKDWDAKDISKIVIRHPRKTRADEVLSIEDTVYSRVLGKRIPKARSWYPDGEEYNPEFVLPATLEALRQVIISRMPYKPNWQQALPREIYEATNYYLGYARSWYDRLKQLGIVELDVSRNVFIRNNIIDVIRLQVNAIFSIWVNDITLDSEGRAENITYKPQPN